MSSAKAKFDSDGFDLDALASSENTASNGEGVIYEIGGGVTKEPTEKSQSRDSGNAEGKKVESPTAEAERLKELGNNDFRQGNYLDAYDYYTDAIEACPYGEGVGPTGAELLKLRDEFDEQERERMMERHRKETDRRKTRPSSTDDNSKARNDNDGDEEEDKKKGPATFSPPRHLYGPKLAVYYANRAATLLNLGRNGEAIEDCDVSLLLNPTYAKALLRRCTAHERTENTEEALKDAKKAVELEPGNSVARKNVIRLQKLEDERLEKLKEETMGKLKDLGNSILGNFGLSLDNFNAVQDPNTGGYSISFNQNAQK